MVFMDWFWLIVVIILIIGGIGICLWACADKEMGIGLQILSMSLVIAGLIFLFRFVVLDWESGATIGIVTSVDSTRYSNVNFYVKTSEVEQEKYCIDSNDVNKFGDLSEYIGKKVKITYGKRVGVYEATKCKQSPIETITVVEE